MSEISKKELPLITYNSLYNLLREEKRLKEKLQELPELYYESLEKFLTDKKEEIKRLKEKKELDKLKKEKRIFQNSIKLSNEILFLRLSKIAGIAIEKEIFNSNNLDEDLNIKIEINFFKDISSLTKKIKLNKI